MRNWFLVNPKKNWSTKKCEIDRTIGRPKRLTKSTWTSLNSVKDIYVVGEKMARNYCKIAKCKSCPFHFDSESKKKRKLNSLSHNGFVVNTS